ncbi:hypothetical protein DSO57_1019142 [Entomophthora muscae]|uniref:Uncharacterized protein n=1 Tax=Entomophthora muscae TaxID=34485 RepID=A0ACC2S6A3_9FUNG|nr:hypothetical protein DSO57_1019142 [Entomophthora muscae]
MAGILPYSPANFVFGSKPSHGWLNSERPISRAQNPPSLRCRPKSPLAFGASSVINTCPVFPPDKQPTGHITTRRLNPAVPHDPDWRGDPLTHPSHPRFDKHPNHIPASSNPFC